MYYAVVAHSWYLNATKEGNNTLFVAFNEVSTSLKVTNNLSFTSAIGYYDESTQLAYVKRLYISYLMCLGVKFIMMYFSLQFAAKT